MISTIESLPRLLTNDPQIDRAFRIALGDLLGNVVAFSDGLLNVSAPVILAGLDYHTPWTRDAAINTLNGVGLLLPQVSKNTLLSVVDEIDGVRRIGGQYWDAIIWVSGAWWHYLYTGDKDFLSLALEITANSLAYFEITEYDPEDQLFRGPACYGDGISAYPDRYAKTTGTGCILDWPEANAEMCARPGFGIPMKALSTNCLYYGAYCFAGQMASELGVITDPFWSTKADTLKQAINRHFWMSDKRRYRYLVDPYGGCNHQEGMGHSFALMFGVADEQQRADVFRNQHVEPAGIPCVWPSYTRYRSCGTHGYGRHSGTVWPHIQGLWSEVAARYRQTDIFLHELRNLTAHANRDVHFSEIYHPVTGEEYGGLQEDGPELRMQEWKSCKRQTWSATAYLRMVLMGLCGMEFTPQGILLRPLLPQGITEVKLDHLSYRGMHISLHLSGSGASILTCKINGQHADPFLPAEAIGEQNIVIMLGDSDC